MKVNKHFFFIGTLAAVGLLSACSDDNELSGAGENGTAVTFNVTNAQDEALQAANQGNGLTRAGFAQTLSIQGVNPADLVPQKLDVEGNVDLDACLLQTTVAGINPVKPAAQTRGTLLSGNLPANFSAIGYRGESATTISTTPWFDNVETTPSGVTNPVYQWAWSQPYGKFYGVFPYVDGSDANIKFDSYASDGTPKVKFVAEENVANQKDFMTAYSGPVQYVTHGTAPQTNLKFYHALTAVKFAIGQNLSADKTISKVEIENAIGDGTYTLQSDPAAAGTWALGTTRKNFTLSGVSVSTAGAQNAVIVGAAGSNYTFFMVPQTLTGNNVYYKVTFSDGHYIRAKLKGEWKPATTVTYTLTQKNSSWDYIITAQSDITFSFRSYSGWATTAAPSKSYSITSYRQAPDGTQQAVPWKVVSYEVEEEDAAGVSSTNTSATKPDWLTTFSSVSGSGGASAETGNAEVSYRNALTDKLAEYNAELKNATLKGSASAPYDLSTKGGTTSMNTANSYLISGPGYYKIPLVYGNAVKNGIDNPTSYTNSVASTSDYGILNNFVDHLGNVITTPYINSQNSSNPATTAKLVWADFKGVVTDMNVVGSGNDSYLTFYVPQDKIANGNAVVAVTDAAGKVMWSWHLWFDKADAFDLIPVKNTSGKTYKFTKNPLGQAYTLWNVCKFKTRKVKITVQQDYGNGGSGKTAVLTINMNPWNDMRRTSTQYQWGRPNALPYIGKVMNNADYKPADLAMDYEKVAVQPIGTELMTIANAIQNPNTFYNTGSTNSGDEWMSTGDYTKYANLWTNSPLVHTVSDEPVVKTIYDPSPAGFHVPESNAFSGFLGAATGSDENGVKHALNVTEALPADWGWKFSDGNGGSIFFPTVGYLQSGNGSGSFAHTYGWYWTAHQYGTQSNKSASDFAFTAYLKNSDGTSADFGRSRNIAKAYGMGVRPVADN